jgi:hypothetical protein
MPYDTEFLRRTVVFGILVVIGAKLIDVVVAGVLGISDTIIVAGTLVLLVGYVLWNIGRNGLSME